jgi:hypothetical protein
MMIPTEADVVGAWHLESMTLTWTCGESMEPFGREPLGTLIYAPTGQVCVSLMAPERPTIGLEQEQFLSRPFRLTRIGALRRFLQAARGHFSYAGSYRIRDGVMQHHVETAAYPDLCGQCLERHCHIEQNRLRLSRAFDASSTVTLVWRSAS